MISKLIGGVVAVGAIALIVVVLSQRREIGALHERLATAEARAQEAEAAAANARMLASEIEAMQKRFQAERQELLQLRGRASRLSELEQENARLQALAQQSRDAAVASRARVPEPVVSKGVDLGVLQLPADVQTRLDLGDGKERFVTVRPLENGNVDLVFTYLSEANGAQVTTQQKLEVFPGNPVASTVDGIEVTFTPQLQQ